MAAPTCWRMSTSLYCRALPIAGFLSPRRSLSSPPYLLYRRVSIVDYRGQVILDNFVQPTMPVSDYRSAVTGIEPHHLASSKLYSPCV